MHITIYTDGSSRGNPGPGGWGSIILTDEEVIELGGREDMTTNNRMELTATIKALKEIDDRFVKHESLEINTDSKYVKDGITEWINGWIKNNWRTSAKKDVLNKDLWQELKAEVDRLENSGVKLVFKYVAGHTGVPLNERADVIATTLADNANIELYMGSKKDYI